MRVVIAGSGRVGSDLALTLSEEGHDVTVIDADEKRFELLGGTFNGTTHTGLAYDVRVLREAGIEFAESFVAVTNSDNANAMAVQVARSVFGVPRTIARLDDPARADAYRAMDIRYIAVTKLTSRVLHEQIVDPEFDYHLTFSGGDVEIVDMVLADSIANVTVSDFEVKGELRVAAIRRGLRTLIPGPDFKLKPGDIVVAAARHGAMGKVKKYLIDVEPELA
ncbi:MAG: TrkA family potassium uptake protein [Acidimicrobiia bacterium]|nr:MAG: TrkA family potassium uptake protein [Acidimicrobiia bacterium]